jgi:hypothetical protein
VLLAQLLLRVAQMRLGLVGDDRARGSDLALDGGDRLAGDFPKRARDARDVGRARRSAELLDPRGDLPLVVARLGQVLAQALLVGHFVGQRDMRGEVDLELGLFGVGFIEPLD